MEYRNIFVGGQWREPASEKRISVECPANREIMGSCPEATEQDVDAAVNAAKSALAGEKWSSTSGEDRASHLDSLSAAIKSRTDDLAVCAAREIAAPYSFCKARSLWPE